MYEVMHGQNQLPLVKLYLICTLIHSHSVDTGYGGKSRKTIAVPQGCWWHVYWQHRCFYSMLFHCQINCQPNRH